MNIFKWLTNNRYRFFYKKFKSVQYSIWDLEFKVSKSRQIREGVRQDRDRAIDASQRVAAAIEGIKDATKRKELEAEKTIVEDNAKRYESQMKMIDDEISGVPAKGDDPGRQGILDTIKAYAELREMYKDYLTKI